MLIFVFVNLYSLSQAQYSLHPFDSDVYIYEYDKSLSIEQYLEQVSILDANVPFIVNDFLHCNNIPQLAKILVRSTEGQLEYASLYPSENINLKHLPCSLYLLSLQYFDGQQRTIYILRQDD